MSGLFSPGVLAFLVLVSVLQPMANSPALAASDAEISVISEVEIRLGIAPPKGWVVEQFENLVEIRFPDLEFNLPSLNDSTAGGLSNVTELSLETAEVGSILRLTLSCSCQVAVLGGQDGGVRILVIAPPPENVSASSLSKQTHPQWAPIPMVKPEAEDVAQLGTGEIDASRARELLLQQLQRAADAGIVDLEPNTQIEVATSDIVEPMPDPSDEIRVAEAASVNGDEETSAEPETMTVVAELPPDSLDAAGNVDRDEQPMDPEVAQEPQCFSEQELALVDIDDSNTFSSRVAKTRRELVGEFDRIDPVAAEDLARIFLSVGLAEEVLDLVDQIPNKLEPLSVMKEMAQVLQRRSLSPDAHFRRDDCVADQALWRAASLANDGLDKEAIASEANAGRALERLPRRVREIIASRLGISAANIGDWESARRFEAMAARAGAGQDNPYGGALLLSARLADWRDEPKAAWDLRQTARQSSPPYDAQALIQLAEMVLRSEELVTSDTSPLQLDLGVLARTARDTTLGSTAFELEARLAGRMEGRDRIVELMAQGSEAGLLRPERRAGLLSALLDEPSHRELSRPIGLIYLDNPDRFTPALLQEEFRQALAVSLAELGVPSLGIPILEDADLTKQHVVLPIAEALLVAGETRQAIDLAQRLPDSPGKSLILGAALTMSGQANKLADVGSSDLSRHGKEIRIVELEAKIEAASLNGDGNTALSLSEQLLELERTPDRAEQHAMLALQHGAESFPVVAREVLEEAEPDRTQRLEALFRPLPERSKVLNPNEASAMIDRLDQEMELLQELIKGG